MGSHGRSDGETAVDETLIRELNRLKDAGNDLAEAAHRVSRTYDGVHRLRLALAGWYQALADEFDRDEGHFLQRTARNQETNESRER